MMESEETIELICLLEQSINLMKSNKDLNHERCIKKLEEVKHYYESNFPIEYNKIIKD